MRITEYSTKVNQETGLCELFKEKSLNFETEYKRFCNAESIFQLMTEVFHMHERAEEYVYMLSFNSKNKLIGVFEVSHGTINTSIMPTREILIRALYSNAANFVIVHNHPSGDTSPSAEDIRVTKKLNEAAQLIGVNFMDHIIVGGNYTSLKEHGLF